MYRSAPNLQSVDQFKFPLDGKLASENRWVKLAQLIPWDEFEAEYAEQFSAKQGAPAKPFRLALGALIVKERLRISDEETVEQIRENPYLQYFIGLESYSDQPPFEASMMVHFRKRISLEMVGRINERLVTRVLSEQRPESELLPAPGKPSTQSSAPGTKALSPQDKGMKAVESYQGEMIVDATCAPADIRYPTDLQLLNAAREHTEAVIDQLYDQLRGELDKKPRTYRRQARKRFLSLSKKRRLSAKQRRKGVSQQLNYIRRNLGHIDRLLELGACLSRLNHRDYQRLLGVSEVFRQQQQMYQQRTRRIDDRIVSLAQPHVRPIVRGKSGTPVEFGAKLSASCRNGFVFLDRLSWDSFHEAGDLPQQAENYKSCFGCYPQTIYADAIYPTRANRNWCGERQIRLMGPPLGRPAAAQKAALAQQARADAKIRNQIEGKFGQAKRRFTLARVMAKLASTAATTIAISFLVMNLERLLQQGFLLFLFAFACSIGLLRWAERHNSQPSPHWQFA